MEVTQVTQKLGAKEAKFQTSFLASESVLEFIRELDRLLDFEDKLRHERLCVRVPGDLFHWPRTTNLSDGRWGTVSLQIVGSGIEIGADIEVCDVSRVGTLIVRNTSWDAENNESRNELAGARMSINDIRLLVAWLVTNFYASSVSVTAKE